MSKKQSRRTFLKSTAGAATAAAAVPYFFASNPLLGDDAKAESKNDRPILGCIGTGSRWNGVGPNAMKFADCVAVCDVDRDHAEKASARVSKEQDHTPEIHEDYRKVLDRKDIDVVTIVTTDHWHTKIAIEAMQAGKDVYCEKPLTLTIEEGKQICKVVKETGRVFQVGTQQRSEMGLRFLKAVAMIRDGRLGDIKRVTCAIGGSPTSGSLPIVEAPSHLNWNLWLGQAPLVAYRFEAAPEPKDKKKKRGRAKTRAHYEFRWWYEYSGGKLTDWGAHHVDIAQWGIDQNGEGQGPRMIEPLMVKHPVPLKDGMPTDDSRYNCATEFNIKCTFAGGVEMFIRNNAKDLGFDNGILFEGTKGRLIVNRNKIEGKPVDELEERPLPEHALTKLYKGREPGGGNAHMRNFFECIKAREQPISDVFTHHAALTTCHLSNIAIRLGRNVKWDPTTQQVVGDDAANAWQTREQRKGFEIVV